MWLRRIIEKGKHKNYLRKLAKVEEKQVYIRSNLYNLNSTVDVQLKDSRLIPVIIINYNQLFYLEQQISFFLEKKFKNIVIIDNNSDYQPLLDYYKKIEDKVTVIRKKSNLGHLVFWKDRKIFRRYSKGFFVISDADVVPNSNLDADFLKNMLDVLLRNNKYSKVGFALNINDIPDEFLLRDKVINWEQKFWKNEIEENVFEADIDTTFALCWPNFDRICQIRHRSFFYAIRMAGDFTAKHGGWYINHENLTEEQKHYYETANASNSWKTDKNGNLIGDFKDVY